MALERMLLLTSRAAASADGTSTKQNGDYQPLRIDDGNDDLYIRLHSHLKHSAQPVMEYFQALLRLGSRRGETSRAFV